MRDRLEEVHVNQWKLAAGGVPDFKSAGIKISWAWPQAIRCRPIPRAIDPMTPYTFGKIHPLARFNLLSRKRCREFDRSKALRLLPKGREG